VRRKAAIVDQQGRAVRVLRGGGGSGEAAERRACAAIPWEGEDGKPCVVEHEVEMGTKGQVRVEGVGLGRGGGRQERCERSAARVVSGWMRDRVGRAHGCGGWKNVGGGGMGVTTAVGNGLGRRGRHRLFPSDPLFHRIYVRAHAKSSVQDRTYLRLNQPIRRVVLGPHQANVGDLIALRVAPPRQSSAASPWCERHG